MRKTSRLAVCVVALLLAAMTIVGPASAAVLKGPVVVTSAGQSPGALMVRVLADRAGVETVFDATASVDLLDGAGSLIVVIGASMKGLGAAGIDVDDEFNRISSLLERATDLGIPVIAMHIEGSPRRGGTSDDFSTMVLSYASHAVVRADGDSDGFFTGLAAETGTTLMKVAATAEVSDVLQELYD